jgi:GTP pyrophosphokinase
MDEMAEQGFAAHWKYKEGNKDTDASETELEKWLHTIKEILDDPQPDAMDFLDAIKLNLFASEIFVFTPKGEIRTMPQNCTALDFAFSIHTFLGSHCIGAKVNHKLVPLSHKLQSGDQVEILTSKSQHVQKEWINFATTAKAKGKIQALLRREERETMKKGEDLLQSFLEKQEMALTSAVTDRLCQMHQFRTRDELYLALGQKKLELTDDDFAGLHGKPKGRKWRTLLNPFSGKKGKSGSIPAALPASEQMPEVPVSPTKPAETPSVSIDKKKALVLDEDTIGRYVMAPCCHPIPGDDALGYIDDKSRIIIHKRQCPVASRLKSSYGNRIVAVKWETHKGLYFDATLHVRGIDHMGVLCRVTEVLSRQMDVNIRKLSVEANDGIFECTTELQVHDVDDVKTIITNLKQIEEIEEVNRIN